MLFEFQGGLPAEPFWACSILRTPDRYFRSLRVERRTASRRVLLRSPASFTFQFNREYESKTTIVGLNSEGFDPRIDFKAVHPQFCERRSDANAFPALKSLVPDLKTILCQIPAIVLFFWMLERR